jgi:CBS domain containing-hemolysin-like protein
VVVQVAEFQQLFMTLMVFGVVSLGFGLIIRTSTVRLGHRLTHIGGAMIALGFFSMLLLPLLFETLSPEMAGVVLLVIFVPLALVILQSILILLFGPNVGSRVSANIISASLMGLFRLVLLPLEFLSWLLRRR